MGMYLHVCCIGEGALHLRAQLMNHLEEITAR
jgi:hypothetical protein